MPAERKYSLDQREKAGELCIYEGLTLEAVADRSGIPLSTIKRWAAEDEWLKRQEEYWQIRRETRIYLAKAQLKLLQEIVDSGNTGVATAAAAIIKTGASLDRGKKQDEVSQDMPEELSEETLRKIKEQIYGLAENVGAGLVPSQSEA